MGTLSRAALVLSLAVPGCAFLSSARKTSDELRGTLASVTAAVAYARDVAERAERRAGSALPLLLAGGAFASTWGKTVYRRLRG